MEKLSSILFIERFPKIDLHGFPSEIASLAVQDFIKDNIKLKNDIIVIIHGIGTGTLKMTVEKVLKKHKNVLEFASYFNNNGCTIVRLKIWQIAYNMVYLLHQYIFCN